MVKYGRGFERREGDALWFIEYNLKTPAPRPVLPIAEAVESRASSESRAKALVAPLVAAEGDAVVAFY